MHTRIFSVAFILVCSLAAFSTGAIADGYDDALAGVKAYQRENYDEAIRLTTQALDSKQLSYKYQEDCFTIRGLAWFSKGEFDKAIADYSVVITDLDPLNPDAFIYRGNARLAKEEYDKAIADYNEVIQMDSQNEPAFHQRGIVQFSRGHFEDAENDLAQALRLDSSPGNVGTAVWIYLSRARLGDSNARAELAADTVKIDPSSPESVIVSMFLDKVGPNAVSALVVNVDPAILKGRTCEADFYVGEWYLLKHRSKRARMLFRKAQNECPKDLNEYAGAVAELKRM
jgi:lipoprotein NlpI